MMYNKTHRLAFYETRKKTAEKIEGRENTG
jgi:hypothetical protein